MLYALVNGKKERASKGVAGVCPLCNEALVPKCGDYVVHHWGHKVGTDCDSWGEGETEWHLAWKGCFHEDNQEVSIISTSTNEKHRADIRTQRNMVIELQNSPIKDSEIEVRTRFYGNMIWIVNGESYGFAKVDFFVNGSLERQGRTNLFTFIYFGRSKLFEKWSRVGSTVFVDFGTPDLFWLKKFDKNTKKGLVQVVSKKELIEKNGGKIISSLDGKPQPSAVALPQLDDHDSRE